MKITRIEAHILKSPKHYKIRGRDHAPDRLSNSTYYHEDAWRHVYSTHTESCLVKITTENGLHGWGECHAPVLPEAPAAVIENLFAPALLGKDALAHEYLFDYLGHLNHVRGHFSSAYGDALAGVDIALWDIKGKAFDMPVHRILGAKSNPRLKAYVSGLREDSLEKNLEAAKANQQAGFSGIKLFTAGSAEEQLHTLRAVREVVGPDFPLYVDLLWKFAPHEATRFCRELDREKVGWIEAPIDLRDIEGHAALARDIDAPIAIGEALRCPEELAPWIAQKAVEIVQPDLMHTGITGGKRMADLAQAHYLPTAFHLGVCTPVGIAATWQLAAAIPNFLIQEHQLGMIDGANRLIAEPLSTEAGQIVVPTTPGLGIDILEEELEPSVSKKIVIE